MSSQQEISFAAYQNITIQVTMSPVTNITGWTLQLNIARNGTSILTNTDPSITDETNGIFTFTLTSTQTGVTMGVGTFQYNVWRTDVGSETLLAYGLLNVSNTVPPPPA
jgi:hypothetical protein